MREGLYDFYACGDRVLGSRRPLRASPYYVCRVVCARVPFVIKI